MFFVCFYVTLLCNCFHLSLENYCRFSCIAPCLDLELCQNVVVADSLLPINDRQVSCVSVKLQRPTKKTVAVSLTMTSTQFFRSQYSIFLDKNKRTATNSCPELNLIKRRDCAVVM